MESSIEVGKSVIVGWSGMKCISKYANELILSRSKTSEVSTYFTLFFTLILGFFYTYFTPQTNLHIYSNTSLPLIVHLIYTYYHTSFTLTPTSKIGSILKCTTENTLPVLLKAMAGATFLHFSHKLLSLTIFPVLGIIGGRPLIIWGGGLVRIFANDFFSAALGRIFFLQN